MKDSPPVLRSAQKYFETLPMFLLTAAVSLWTSGLVVLVTTVAATIDGSPHASAPAAERIARDIDDRFVFVQLACGVIALSSWFSLKERFGTSYRNRRTMLSMLLAMTLCASVSALVLAPWREDGRPATGDTAAAAGPSHGTYLVLSLATAALGLSVLFVVSRHAVRSLNALERKA